jgi:hypothetical protein
MASRTKPKVDTTTRVPLSELRLLGRNPRKGNVGAVAASLKANDQYRPVVANIGSHTGRPNEVVKGNHTLKALRALAKRDPEDERWHTVLVHWIDVDDAQLKAIALVDNKARENGSYDNEMLAGQLTDLGDLTGTGFTQDLLDALGPAPEDWATDADVDGDAITDYVEEPQEDPEQFSGRGTQVISYSIVFDDLKQRQQWIDFMNWLKRTYPENTPAERIDLYLHALSEDKEPE